MSRNYCTECGSYKTASLGMCSFGNIRSEFCSTIHSGLCNDSDGQHNICLMEDFVQAGHVLYGNKVVLPLLQGAVAILSSKLRAG